MQFFRALPFAPFAGLESLGDGTVDDPKYGQYNQEIQTKMRMIVGFPEAEPVNLHSACSRVLRWYTEDKSYDGTDFEKLLADGKPMSNCIVERPSKVHLPSTELFR